MKTALDDNYYDSRKEELKLEIESLEEMLRELRWKDDSFSKAMKKSINYDINELRRKHY